MIDGLAIEGSALPEVIATDDVAEITLSTVSGPGAATDNGAGIAPSNHFQLELAGAANRPKGPGMTSIGEALVQGLKARGVEVVFGIPGVHTIELYRGLPGSGIRHVTSRHEGGAGFMADGYARVCAKPGVAFVITGPGVTNILTPMGQARADSVPVLVVSGVNGLDQLGKGLGFLHELPDQLGMVAKVALHSERIGSAAQLGPALERAFAAMGAGSDGPRRGGPVHLEVPLDVMALPCPALAAPPPPPAAAPGDAASFARAASLLRAARRPLILVGGGARRAGSALQALAERLDAPVIQTANARGLMHRHPLTVAASPSLAAVRALIDAADQVLAVGTEFGPTEYDMNDEGSLRAPHGMIRIDIDAGQLGRRPSAVALQADAGPALAALLALIPTASGVQGAARAASCVAAARAGLAPAELQQLTMLEALRSALPCAILVGDSTQPVYAGNLAYDHDRPGGWFNAATGFGSLGYAVPAAVGAAIAAPQAPVVCLVGDGGLQFSLAEMMVASDEGLNILFLVWNNHGYRAIADAMRRAAIPVLGCDPSPPLLEPLATAFGLPFRSAANTPAALAEAVAALAGMSGPKMLEIRVD